MKNATRNRISRLLPIAILVVMASPAFPVSAGVNVWTSSGPEGAVVIALAAHPSNPSTVYVATFRRVYKSVDGGTSWAPTGLSGYFDLPLPTSAPAVAYAILTDPHGFGAAFHRTSDGGESWVGRATPPGHFVLATVDSNDPMALYAVTTSGLFRTTNGGDAWEPLATPSAGGFGLAGIAVDPVDSRVLYAALTAGNVPGVHRSSDLGATWNRTNLQIPTRALLFDPSDDTRLFALTNAGLQVTTNRGESWRRLAPGQQEPSHLAIDPNDSNRLYIVSGGVVFHSSDGGETMTPVHERNFGGNIRALAASESSVVLVGSDRGVSRSEDAGRLWEAANLGIREVFIQSVAIDPTDPAVVFAAGPEGIYESRDGGETWNEPVPQSPDAEVVAIDPSEHSTLYAGGEGGVHKSTDGGRTWQNTGLVDYIAELLIDPSNPRRILAAYGGVYRSLDGADRWSRVLTPDDDYSSYYYPPTVTAMDLAPSDSVTVFAGGSDGGGFLYRSDDGGDHWSDLHVDFPVNALAIDSCDPRIVQAGAWGAVFRTIDGGNTWSPSSVSQGQPYPVAVWALARDPRHSSSVFAGTSAGLFWTNDRGASWTRFEPALTKAIHSVALDPSGRFLYAGTEKGVFSLERTFDRCRDGPDRLCLIGAKFQVSVTARDERTGARIEGRAITEGDQFGYFSFPDVTGDPLFPEVFVKMVDARGAPAPYGGHAWVFHSSLTNLDYTLTVIDTETGRIRTYDAVGSRSLTCGEADTSAFARACVGEEPSASLPFSRLAAASGAELSLLEGRFRATIRATDPRTGRIAGGAAIARQDGFGYFSLPDFTGDPRFPEVFVKMVDGRTQPGRSFWVFHTGLTDLAYTLTVTDTVTGAVQTYAGGATAGTFLCGSADTTAFPEM
jgi:photosystem II stability/assembly factor-like uncharacterized protein